MVRARTISLRALTGSTAHVSITIGGKTYRQHPGNAVLPRMRSHEFLSLCRSMVNNGFLDFLPIHVTPETEVLDGWHRLRGRARPGRRTHV